MSSVLVFPPLYCEPRENDDFTVSESTLVYVRRITSFGLGAGFITEYEVLKVALDSGKTWRSARTPSIKRAIQVYRAEADRPENAPELKLVIGRLS